MYLMVMVMKNKSTRTVTNLLGRGPKFILPPRIVRRMVGEEIKSLKDHCWRVTEKSSILGSPLDTTSIPADYLEGMSEEKAFPCHYITNIRACT